MTYEFSKWSIFLQWPHAWILAGGHCEKNWSFGKIISHQECGDRKYDQLQKNSEQYIGKNSNRKWETIAYNINTTLHNDEGKLDTE